MHAKLSGKLQARPHYVDEVYRILLDAIVHLPLVSSATKIVYGRDFLADLPVRDYIKAMGQRPHVATVNADRKTSTELMLARPKAKG